ncbi:MAG: hypothetical protein KDD45_04465 [Bdellovibrionales bacterium]|nr:hypothetical protein [Bdellovibrionales bacterium]
MYKKSLIIILAMTSLVLVNCSKAKTDEEVSSVSDSTALIESGVTAISGAADDQSETSYAVMTPVKNQFDLINQLLLPKCYAASCSRALDSTCSSGIQSTSFSSCSLGSSRVTVNGNIQLAYSSSACDMSATGNTVTRTYNYSITGPRGGGVITTSSNSHSDYENNQIGGGAKITRLAAGYKMEILGKHKVFTLNNKTLFDISMHSDSANPLVFSGSLVRNQRVLANGKLILSHNLAKYSTTFTMTNLKWTSVCCHPIEGQIAVEYSGSKTGAASVTFTSCGMAQLEKDGQTEQIELSYCE